MKCKRCGGTAINAHIESVHIHRVVAEDGKKIVLAKNPKHIEDDETTLWCATCSELVDDLDVDEKDIIFDEGTP
jgi:hypothetical protein